MKKRLQIAILSVLLAVFSWYLVTGREKVETIVEVPVEMTNPPKGMIIRSGLPSKLEVRVRGPKGLVRGFSERKPAYNLDAGNMRVGENVVVFQVDNIPMPGALDVVDITPSKAVIVVDRMVVREVPVEVVLIGKPDPDYEVAEMNATPALVALKGPASLIGGIKAAPAQAVDVEGSREETFVQVLGLDVPQGVEVQPGRVEVAVGVRVRKRRLWIKKRLDVEAPEGMKYDVGRTYVRMEVQCPVMFFRDNGFRKQVKPLLVLSGALEPGEYELPYRVEMPRFCDLTEAKPEKVEVGIKP